MMSVLEIAAPIAITAAAAGLVANLVQNRPRITGAGVKPQWSRINPRTGFKRLVGTKALFDAGKTIDQDGRRRRGGVPRHLAAADEPGPAGRVRARARSSSSSPGRS